jgi:hypothetical protein
MLERTLLDAVKPVVASYRNHLKNGGMPYPESDALCAAFEKEKGKRNSFLSLLEEKLPSPEKLELLAYWLDSKHPNDYNPEVKADLRKWAQNIREIIGD